MMPTADHTFAVDAKNPLVPMGTKVIMSGQEYLAEDTGNLEQSGVHFDIYFDDHNVALQWGRRTVEAYLADGDENDVKVTKKGSYVMNLNYEDYIALGKLTEEQEELLREVMSEKFRSEIPSFGIGSDVATAALEKVGCKTIKKGVTKRGIMTAARWYSACMRNLVLNFHLLHPPRESLSLITTWK